MKPDSTASDPSAAPPGDRTLPAVRCCLLFVPGTRPDRFAKAAAAGAGTICLDLEDAVPDAQKALARAEVLRFLAEPPVQGVERAVRINALTTAHGAADVQALRAAGVVPDVLVVPKVRAAEELRSLAVLWGPRMPPLLAILETAAGVLHAEEIAAHARAGLLFGAADLATELNVAAGSPMIDHARGMAILAAAAAGVEILDTPFLEVRDAAGLAAQAQRARTWGFTGLAAIHPAQVPVIRAAFLPTAAEVDEAQRGLAAFAAAGGAACLLDGRLIEKPIAARYQRILALAGRGDRGSAGTPRTSPQP